MEKQPTDTPTDSLAGLDLESARIAITRIQMRLQDAHRERMAKGSDDLNVGYRTGLLHALNIASNVRRDMDEAAEADKLRTARRLGLDPDTARRLIDR